MVEWCATMGPCHSTSWGRCSCKLAKTCRVKKSMQAARPLNLWSLMRLCSHSTGLLKSLTLVRNKRFGGDPKRCGFCWDEAPSQARRSQLNFMWMQKDNASFLSLGIRCVRPFLFFVLSVCLSFCFWRIQQPCWILQKEQAHKNPWTREQQTEQSKQWKQRNRSKTIKSGKAESHVPDERKRKASKGLKRERMAQRREGTYKANSEGGGHRY